MEAMEAISEGKIHISPDLRVYVSKMENIKDGKYPEVLEKCEYFKVHAGDASLLYWWHVLCQC